MSLLRRTAAQIYIDELRKHVDKRLVPVFEPDNFIEVGDYGKLENGRFIGTGSIAADHGLELQPTEHPTAATDFASSGKVSITPSLEATGPGGIPLVKASINFGKSRAVAAAFSPGVDRRVAGVDAFGEHLKALWREGSLRTDRCVVWQVRRANGGTVVISEEGDNSVELRASPTALAGAALTLGNLANLGVGVQFGTERKATWKMSDASKPLTVSIGLLRLSGGDVADVFGFEESADVRPGTVLPVEVDDLLTQLS